MCKVVKAFILKAGGRPGGPVRWKSTTRIGDYFVRRYEAATLSLRVEEPPISVD
jgi:hypothetical protein